MGLLEQLKAFIAGRPRDEWGGATGTRHLLKDWSREELEDAIAAMTMGDVEERQERNDWFWQYYLERHERNRLKQVLTATYHTEKELNRAVHVADLEEKVARLKREVRWMQEASERRNKEAWATGLIVHCTGCEAGAPENASDLTEEKVKAVEGVARRLRAWWNNHTARLERKAET